MESRKDTYVVIVEALPPTRLSPRTCIAALLNLPKHNWDITERNYESRRFYDTAA
ncbi:MAG: hypothetical protein ACW99U_00060 [Candidatus Thorarchaeota archaeon]